MSQKNQTTTLDSSKRFRIGVLLDSIEDYFNKRIIKDLIDLAEERNILIIFYFGNPSGAKHTVNASEFIYNLPDPSLLDALIVFPDSISPYDPVAKTLSLVSSYASVPIYSFYTELPNHYSVVANEEPGIKNLIKHLVKYHAYKDFALLTGPNRPGTLSRKRFELINKYLNQYNIKISEENIFWGSFTKEDGIKTAEKIITRKQKKPDVLICFNDQMAISVIDTFLKNNILIPQDIAVVGIDDVDENTCFDFSFTTIDFPVWAMCTTLINQIESDLKSKTKYNAKTILFDSVFKNRESCGCDDWIEEIDDNVVYAPVSEKRTSYRILKQTLSLRRKIREVLKQSIKNPLTTSFLVFINDEIQTLSKSGQLTDSFIDNLAGEWTIALHNYPDFSDQLTINTLFIDTFKLLLQERTTNFAKINTLNAGSLNFYRQSIDLLSQQLTLQDSIRGIAQHLPLLTIYQLYLVFISHDHSDKGTVPLYYSKTDKFLKISFPNKEIHLKGLVSTNIYTHHHPIAVLPISYNDVVFGYLSISITNKQFEQFALLQEMVSQIISQAIENDHLHTHIESLNQKNKVLSELSLIDDFTGLYNRRGLYVKGSKMFLKAQTQQLSSTFLFFDLDGLKKINDNFGHLSGDVAIKSFASILRSCFREDDLVVRFGGDEFIVLLINSKKQVSDKALSRIRQKIINFNESKQYKWILSVSWGLVHNTETDSSLSFESLIEQSDRILYKQKRAKRKN